MGRSRSASTPRPSVDADHQVIIATDLNNCAADSQTFAPMMAQASRNTGRAPKQALADAGYCSQANLEAAAKLTERDGTQFLIGPGRLGHDEVVEPAPRGRVPKDLTLKQRMARTLRTKPGKAGYARRKAIVEPVFGQIAPARQTRPAPRPRQRPQRVGPACNLPQRPQAPRPAQRRRPWEPCQWPPEAPGRQRGPATKALAQRPPRNATPSATTASCPRTSRAHSQNPPPVGWLFRTHAPRLGRLLRVAPVRLQLHCRRHVHVESPSAGTRVVVVLRCAPSRQVHAGLAAARDTDAVVALPGDGGGPDLRGWWRCSAPPAVTAGGQPRGH